MSTIFSAIAAIPAGDLRTSGAVGEHQREMLISAKLAPTFEYATLERFWRDADELGYHAVWDYDHFYGLADPATPTLEGWTTLAAMGVITRRARVGCMVTGVTYRHPAVLANEAVTVDHISGGRLEFGIGAAWHEPEHQGYGIPFPSNGTRVAMLDEALTVIKLLWTEDKASFEGKFWRLEEALCNPKPVQSPHPPIVVGGMRPKMLQVIAKHANEWNAPIGDPVQWGDVSAALDKECEAAGRKPSDIRRSVQLFLHPNVEGQAEAELEKLPAFEDAGCEHVVLSFYAPPTREMLERSAPGRSSGPA
jgi:F420-dependent oxidoreductase-like protein